MRYEVKTQEPEDRFWYFGALWRAFVVGVESLTDIFGLFYRLAGSIGLRFANRRLMEREFAQQIYRIGACGWPALAITALLLGLSIIVYVSAQLKRIQAGELVGNLLVVLVVRELGPIFTALLVLLRSGATMIVEIGSMVVDREIESLELMGVEPEIFIGAPRFWGLIISLVILYGIFLASAILGGYVFGQLLAAVFWQDLWQSFLNALRWQDLVISGGKILLFGMSLGTVAIYYGLRAEERLGSLVEQTSKGMVTGLFFLGILNAIISFWGYD
jgi:phospholipid/cholesterol/gamma-HCH transport system permease protein